MTTDHHGMQLLEQANPVPDPRVLRVEPDADRYLRNLLATRLPGRDDTSPRRHTAIIWALSAALVALLVGGVVLIGTRDEPKVRTDNPTGTTASASTVPTSAPPTSSPVPSGEVASPLIGMRSLLTNRADDELFVVQSDGQSYWRLATLARFDGTTWGFPESVLTRADGELSAVRDVADELRQEVRIVGLGGRLIPAAAEPVAVSGSNILWNEDSATLLSTDGDLVAGAVYDIVSVSSRVTSDDLQRATSTNPGDPIYTELPDDLPSEVVRQAVQVTAGYRNNFEAARLLQAWFHREFEYSLEVQAGHGNTAMEFLLRDRIGYSEQFAGTYAAMMRALGIPARVAVGFTHGADAADEGASVLGKHAHAWPEVWFDGLGWVPFEPTPGRGVPGAEDSTNVVVQQGE